MATAHIAEPGTQAARQAASRRVTQVGIIGAGPAGLLMSYLLHRAGIDNVLLEQRDRGYTLERVRAGVLEQGTVEFLTDAGLGERLRREGLEHHGIYLQYDGERHRVPFADLIDRSVWVYSQQEVVKDLVAALEAAGTPALYEAEDVAVHDLTTDRPLITYRHGDDDVRLECGVIVGADGFHGVSRPSIPGTHLTTYQRDYPFAWLGILANVAPSTDELIYALHSRGFAMHSMRSNTVSRLYLQVDPTDHIDNWADERIWAELDERLAVPGWTLSHGEIFDKGITPMRSFVSSSMRYGQLFLVGDAAHIVPPTGAKGLNLAIWDVALLSTALEDRFLRGDVTRIDAYSDAAIRRIWQVQYFSTWMTRMLHRFSETPGAPSQADEFDYQVQVGQLSHLVRSPRAMAHLSEYYTGLELALGGGAA